MFPSPKAAQAWMESRKRGYFLPVFFLVYFVLFMLYIVLGKGTMEDIKGGLHWFLLFGFLAGPFFQGILMSYILKLGEECKQYLLVFSKPLFTRDLAYIKLKAGMIAILETLFIFFVVLAWGIAILLLHGKGGVFTQFFSRRLVFYSFVCVFIDCGSLDNDGSGGCFIPHGKALADTHCVDRRHGFIFIVILPVRTI